MENLKKILHNLEENSYNYISIFPSLIKESSNNRNTQYILEAVVIGENTIEQEKIYNKDKKITKSMVSVHNSNQIMFHPITILRVYEKNSQTITFRLFEQSTHNLICMVTIPVYQICGLSPVRLDILSEKKIKVGQLLLKSIQLKQLKETISFTLKVDMILSQNYPIKKAFIILIGKSNVHFREEIEIIQGELLLNKTDKCVRFQYEVQEMKTKYLFAKRFEETFKIKLILRGCRPEENIEMQGEYCFIVKKDDIKLRQEQETQGKLIKDNQQTNNDFTLLTFTYELKNVNIKKVLTLNRYMKTSSLNFNLIMGLDFSESCKALHDISLKYIKNNPYVQAITIIGKILLQICSCKDVSVYGFGGIPQLPHFNKQWTQHYFPIIGYQTYPNLTDIKGVLSAYFNILDKNNNNNNNLEFGKITKLCPLIHQVSVTAQIGKNQSQRNYYILLIITDGISQDMSKAIDHIKACNDLPISFIIAAVGNENFEGMESLNNPNFYEADRDMIIFFKLNDFHQDTEKSLTSYILHRFKEQVEQYYENNPIDESKPNNILQNNINNEGVEESEKADIYKLEILSQQIERIKQALMPLKNKITGLNNA